MLFLIRHAHAVPAEEDPLRPLSLRGAAECSRLVSFFAANGCLRPDQLWHSALVRSRETADRLATGLRLDAIRLETPGLEPDDDPQVTLARIDALPPLSNVALVGHNPHLGHLATLLMRGKSHPELIEFKKASVACLVRTDHTHKGSPRARWQLRWFITPPLLASDAPTPPAT